MLSDNGDGLGARFRGELGDGEDGPGEEDVGMGGVGLDVEPEGDLDLPSPDLVRDRFCIVNDWTWIRKQWVVLEGQGETE